LVSGCTYIERFPTDIYGVRVSVGVVDLVNVDVGVAVLFRVGVEEGVRV
jgi:hypothetical protein